MLRKILEVFLPIVLPLAWGLVIEALFHRLRERRLRRAEDNGRLDL
ncbi:MAG TPA: hypothetical protein VMZ50_03490 [Phycisphaerae bacterium]|nr:hypothetical protein [Phycisphaerae bacterium]